jgi:hypothetical protein
VTVLHLGCVFLQFFDGHSLLASLTSHKPCKHNVSHYMISHNFTVQSFFFVFFCLFFFFFLNNN